MEREAFFYGFVFLISLYCLRNFSDKQGRESETERDREREKERAEGKGKCRLVHVPLGLKLL